MSSPRALLVVATLGVLPALGLACGGGDGGGGGASGGPTADAAPLQCDPGDAPQGGRCAPVGAPICADADGAACGAARGCAAGTTDFLGEEGCAPVGPASCPDGFVRDGFGCAPVVAATCTGATRAKLGDAACAPVGDCDAAFPPAAATLFVDDDYTAGQIDATHKAKIQEAIDAAPAGATIAIAKGTYTGALTLPRAVTLVGQCAQGVTLVGSATAAAGLTVDGPRAIRVSGVTITGFEPGVDAHGGATVDLTSVVVEKNRRSGLSVADKGTRLTATGSAIRGNLPDASARFGQGVAVGFDAAVTIADSEVADNGEMAVNALKSGSAKVTKSVLRRSIPRASNGAYGWGIGAQTQGSFEIEESLVEDVVGGAAVVVEKGTKGAVLRSVLRKVGPGATSGSSSIAACALTQLEGDLTVTGSTLSGTEGSGVQATDSAKAHVKQSAVVGPVGAIEGTAAIATGKGGAVDLDSVAVVDPRAIGLLVPTASSVTGRSLLVRGAKVSALATRGEATLERVVFEDTRAGSGAGGSFGSAVYVDTKGRARLTSAIVRSSDGIAIIANGAGASLELHRSVVVRSRSVPELPGTGVAASAGAAIVLEGSAVLNQPGIALHAADPGTVVTVTDSTLGDARIAGTRDRGRALNLQDGARATLERTAILRAGEVGVTAIGEGTEVRITDAIVEGTALSANQMAHGSVAAEGAFVSLLRTRIKGNVGAGLIFSGSAGIVQTARIEDNGVGVQATSSSKLVDADRAPDAPEPKAVYVLSDTRFTGNTTKVGGQDLPVPGRVIVAK